MHNNEILQQLSDEIEKLQEWIVDHPLADYYAKMEVLNKWTEKTNQRQAIIQRQLQQLTN